MSDHKYDSNSTDRFLRPTNDNNRYDSNSTDRFLRLTYDNHNILLLTYNPTTKYGRFSNKLSKFNKNPNFGIKYFGRKLSQEFVYNMLDSDKASTLDFNFIKGSSNQFAQSYTRRKILRSIANKWGRMVSKKAKLGFAAFDGARCMNYELNNLDKHNMFFSDNISIAKTKCAINTTLNYFNSELTLGQSMLSGAGFAALDVGFDHAYINKPNEHGFFRRGLNFIDEVHAKFFLKPLAENITSIWNPVEKLINYAEDHVFDYIGDAAYEIYYNTKLHTYFENDNSSSNNSNNIGEFYNNYLDNYDLDDNFNFINNDNNTNNSTNNPTNYYDLLDEYEYDYPYNVIDSIENTTANDNTIDTNTIDTNTDMIQIGEELAEKDKKYKFYISDDTLEKLKHNLQNISTTLDIIALIKKIRDLDYDIGDIIVELEALLINFKTDNGFINGYVRCFADLVHTGEITRESIINFAISCAEDIFDLPLSNAVHFVDDLMHGNSVDKYIIPLALDIISIICPQLAICRMIYKICQTIDALLTKQKQITISGIDIIYTDKTKIGFFKISHKISMDNDFYGIHVSNTTRHARDAKRIVSAEVEKQLDYKVYQVIGIPIEILNNTILKPTTRYGIYKYSVYIRNLEEYWLEVNGKYLTEDEKAAITNMYFESSEDFKYREDLANKGLSPSWYYLHKHDNIIDFFKGLYEIIKDACHEDINAANFHGFNLFKIYNEVKHYISTVYHQLFDNNQITPTNIKDNEGKQQHDGFEDAKNKRNGKDNNELTEFRNKHREMYNNGDGVYSRQQIIIIASRDLLQRQLTVYYIMETSYSTSIGFIGSKLAYIDKEVKILYDNPIAYTFKKGKEFISNMKQSYITRILTDQAITTVSLMKITENLSDDFLMKYINPLVGSSVGIVIGCLRYLATWNKNKEENKFKYVVMNGAVSAVNTSFGMIYNYCDDMGMLSFVKTTKWMKVIKAITFLINKTLKITIGINLVAAIATAVLFNLGIRLASYLYNLIKNPKPKKKKLEYIIPEFQRNPVIPEFQRSPVIPEFQRMPIIPDYHRNPVIPEFQRIIQQQQISCNESNCSLSNKEESSFNDRCESFNDKCESFNDRCESFNDRCESFNDRCE